MRLRQASISDGNTLLAWRNDETTRENSFDKSIVSSDTHFSWLKDHLSELFIAVDNENNSVGVVRYNGNELSWTVSPEHRRKGIGSSMVKLFISQFRPYPCFALIMNKNIPSQKIAKNAMMVCVSDDEGVQRWGIGVK